MQFHSSVMYKAKNLFYIFLNKINCLFNFTSSNFLLISILVFLIKFLKVEPYYTYKKFNKNI